MKHVLGARDLSREWRFAALAGITAGLAAAPLAPPDPAITAVGAAPVVVITLAGLRPRERSRERVAIAWLALVALAASLAGLLAGGARIQAIDAGALRGRPGVQPQ